MNVQHLDVKVPLADKRAPNLDALIPVFHRWVRERAFDDLLIDVADYRHVTNGPGLLAVGHEGNFSLDLTEGVPGLRYVRKAVIAGDAKVAFAQALSALNKAEGLLAAEPVLNGAFKLNWRRLDVRINDRLLAPNHPETYARLQPELTRFFDGLVGPGKVQLELHAHSRELFRVTVRSSQPIGPALVGQYSS